VYVYSQGLVQNDDHEAFKAHTFALDSLTLMYSAVTLSRMRQTQYRKINCHSMSGHKINVYVHVALGMNKMGHSKLYIFLSCCGKQDRKGEEEREAKHVGVYYE